MTHGTAKVDQATFSQKDDVFATLEREPVNLGLDVGLLFTVVFQVLDVNLTVEMANVTHDGIVLHGLKVFASNNVLAAGGCHENVGLGDCLLHSGDLVAFAAGLECVDGVDLGNDDTAAEATEGLGTALADITVSGDESDLSGQHDVGGTLDTVDKGFAATVKVVKLGLGHAVVDIDGRNLKVSLLEHFVQVVDSGGGFFRQSSDSLQKLWVLCVDEVGQVTSIVKDHVQGFAIGEVYSLLDTPDVFFVSLSLPCVDWDTAGGHGGGSVVLSGENVATGPGDVCAQFQQGLDQAGGLDGHVQATGDAGTLEGLGSAVLLAQVHQTRHLVLGHGQLLATEVGKADVSNFVCGLAASHYDEVERDEKLENKNGEDGVGLFFVVLLRKRDATTLPCGVFE